MRGVTFLGAGVALEAISRVVESEAWGPVEQPDFLNVALRGRTSMDAHELLAFCREAEKDAGREERVRWGPRELDVDVILFGTARIDTPALQVPHPRWADRPFVTRLVAEVAGDMRDPISGQRLDALLGEEPLPPELREYARIDHLLEGA